MLKPPPNLPDKQTTEQYVQQYYCTLEYLLKTCDVTETEFFAYVDAGCLPQHSYQWQQKITLNSFIATQDWPLQTVLYYHPRHILLLHDLVALHRYMSLEDIATALCADFKTHYQAKLKELDAFSDVLQDYDEAKLETFLEKEWQNYLQGIYGLCTNDPTPENIAVKEIMMARIRLLTAEGAKAALTDEEQIRLKPILQVFAQVLAPFAPYELAHSSRQKWLNAIVAKYKIEGF